MRPHLRSILVSLLALPLWLGATRASAAPAHGGHASHDPLAARTFLISADRLFGLTNNRTTTATNNGDRSVSHTGLSLLLSSPTTVYMRPRVALDVTVIPGLTVGGAFGLFVGDREDAATAGDVTTSAEGPTTRAVVVAPRVGYALDLNGIVTLWPRLGLTYFSTGTEVQGAAGGTVTTSSSRTSGLALDLEPALLIAPFASFGFTVAFVADLPLSGTLTREVRVETNGATRITRTDTDQKLRNLGLVLGMTGMF